jgi:hypothetical protein
MSRHLPTDLHAPPWEQLPRRFVLQLTDNYRDPQTPVTSVYLHDAQPNVFPEGPIFSHDDQPQGFATGQQLGDSLTDRSYIPDGFRHHDVLHAAVAAVTGWSPVLRGSFNVRRRSDTVVDHIEDGGRAVVAEEGIVLLGFHHRHDLQMVSPLMSDLAQGCLDTDTAIDPEHWEQAFVIGHNVLDRITAAIGTYQAGDAVEKTAYIQADLDHQSLDFSLTPFKTAPG